MQLKAVPLMIIKLVTAGVVLGLALVAAATSGPVYAIDICSSSSSDSDHDGWGWENGASCRVANDQQSENSVDSPAFPGICSSTLSDPDGDGWGWENGSSCVTADIAFHTDADTGPLCVSGSSDPDGDGWGWENGRSCQIQPSATDPATTQNVVECEFPASDLDGDGWGWENNQTCQVVVGLPDTTTPDLEPAEPEQPRVLRIMALGDSITHGVLNGNAPSYRKPFIAKLDAQSCAYQMVGSQTTNLGHAALVSPHEGYSGHTADEILYGHVDDAGSNEGVVTTVTRYQPDVVLMHVGTNDMRLGQNISQTMAEIDQIVSAIFALSDGATVLIANLIPWYASDAENDVVLLGDQIERYVADRGNPQLRLVDVRSGYDEDMMLSDKAHPNAEGEERIAAAFHASLLGAGFCR